MKKLKGTGVALITPLLEDKSIDFEALKKIVDFVSDGGVDYLVVMGTTGESATLNKAEKVKVLQAVSSYNKLGLPIVYGIGGNDTHALLEEINSTDLQSVDAILSVSPYYNKPAQSGIIAHFESIANASPVPIMLYNIPGRTMSNMSAQTTLTLANHPNIIGMKEASGNMEQCMQIVAHKPKEFLLISGDDMLTSAMRAIGCEGVISVLANAYPDIIKEIIHGNAEASMKATFRLLEINSLMYEESNPVGIKYLMSQMGLCRGEVRLPLIEASSGLQEKIKAAASRV
ncbi:4-hydroxy-tetrahydrodipicolinate synthase [Pararhodonellum marinum]|uniref:4-hydroxy-tetrahydrodipicolinate synthase n=1 Tax=Pararhodonellum marinum TaxID=2755358 RepID=UPI00188DC90B|nr:4-hydroxy-tetrahydrodipicolinate synthase [Pararhodonellum marinum]